LAAGTTSSFPRGRHRPTGREINELKKMDDDRCNDVNDLKTPKPMNSGRLRLSAEDVRVGDKETVSMTRNVLRCTLIHCRMTGLCG